MLPLHRTLGFCVMSACMHRLTTTSADLLSQIWLYTFSADFLPLIYGTSLAWRYHLDTVLPFLFRSSKYLRAFAAPDAIFSSRAVAFIHTIQPYHLLSIFAASSDYYPSSQTRVYTCIYPSPISFDLNVHIQVFQPDAKTYHFALKWYIPHQLKQPTVVQHHTFFFNYFLCGLSGYCFAFFFKRTIKAFQPDVETCRAIAFRRHTAYKRLLCLLLWRLSLTIRYTSWDWRPYYFRRSALLRSCNPMSWHATLTPKVAYHLYHSVISAADCNIMLVSGGYTDYRFFMRYLKAIYLF